MAILQALAGLASAAVKGGKASRARKISDDAYNARRRYYRQAERYEKKANEAGSPIEAGRMRKLGARALEKAISTYEDPTKAKFSKPIQDLMESLNPRQPLRKPSAGFQQKAIEESESALSDGMSEYDRRESEAEDILTGAIGRRVYGALVDVWKDYDGDRNDAILEHFGASNMMEVIEAIEAAGIDIYSDPESEQKYDEVRTAIELAFRK